MVQPPTSTLENRAEKNLTRGERGHPNKEHHRDRHHYSEHSYPRRDQDGDNRHHRERDYSKQSRDCERQRRKERSEEKSSHARGGYGNEHRTRENRDRKERDYYKRESRDRHHDQERKQRNFETHENYEKHSNQQRYRDEKEVSVPSDEKAPYRYNNYTETPPPEYIVAEDKRSEMYYHKPEDSGGILNCHSCRYLCTNRGLCQLVEVLLNLLILICGAISYSGTGGYTDLSSLGSLYYYTFGSAYSGFQGAEAEKVNELDVAFYQLKLPTVIAIMAYSGALLSFACLMLVLGLARIPWRFTFLLIIESVLDIVIALGYIPAIYFYFQHLIESYRSEVCKEREEMYKSKGYDGFNCSLHGADIVGGLCGCLAIIIYVLNAVAAALAFRKVRRLKGMREEVYIETTIV
ncbi:MARVEL domain-containing protein 3-like isoform X1 [Stegostoma tigrinum]|uniref:MARVEL domain-containing protein 3-like isoform X1 n=1 Tax=Stegostoma tigrinum TaxID=3053191 RepID=UPI0028707F8C|nr:MARVEL domain-containing protein 3-like isoform X1 [Stegostoma tigrinum]XP_048402620.2 MARVEL domain-containing protein 3-like isoform X1 [Stegostoma tigrinum]